MKISIGLDFDLLDLMLNQDLVHYLGPKKHVLSEFKYLGNDDELEFLTSTSNTFVFGLDKPQYRKKLDHKYNLKGLVLKSSLASLSKTAEILPGTTIADFAFVSEKVLIGRFCKLNVRSSVHHQSRIGNYVVIGPSATICGNVEIGDSVFIGAGAVVLPNVRIGADSVIGAGSVVTKEVKTGETVVGAPARNISKN